MSDVEGDPCRSNPGKKSQILIFSLLLKSAFCLIRETAHHASPGVVECQARSPRDTGPVVLSLELAPSTPVQAGAG